MKKNPPIVAERFFRWFCNYRHLEGLEGDLYELFQRRVNEQGIAKARFYYVFDIVTLLRLSVAKPFFQFSNKNFMEIFISYLKIAFRHGMKRKEFSFINIAGLIMGITSILFISLYVKDELRYDSQISNAQNKYRVFNIRYSGDGEVNYLPIVPPVFSHAIKDNFPQVEKTGRLLFDYRGTVFTVGEKSFSETNGVFAERTALEILDVKMVENNFDNFTDPMSILVSQSLYKKFFGNVPYNNQVVQIGKIEVKVAGIFKDLPPQSHLKLDYIFNFQYVAKNITEERMNSWVWQQFFTYIQLKPGTDVPALEAQIQTFVQEKSKPNLPQDFYYIPHLQNVRDIYLHSSNFEWDIAQHGSYQSIVFLSLAAAIILLIACLNFINLTTAQALRRSKEVSVRKFVGARRSQLLAQYCVESIIYTCIAGAISLILFVLLLPYFNTFTGKLFYLKDIFILNNILLYASFLIIIGIIAGLQPAVLLSSFKPLHAIHGLSNALIRSRSGIKLNVRQILVGVQFVLSTGLIIISLIIQKQYNFLENTDMGFKKENLLVIPLTRNLRANLDATKASFTDFSNIKNATMCYGIPGGIFAGDGITLPDKPGTDNKQGLEESCNMFIVDEDYISTMGMKIIAGRDFSHDIKSDEAEGFIINETAVKNFGLKTPEKAIGTRVEWPYWGTTDSLKKGEIIGVVKDFNFKSLHNSISSLVLHMNPSYVSTLVLRLGNGDIPSTMSFIEKQYRKYEPKRPFDFQFVDQSFDKFYKSEQKLSVLFTIFTVLAIVTAAIGLFGLVSHSVTTRSKEISIRKVLGAEVNTIFRLLVQRYFILVVICLGIAIPISYYFSNAWLTNFAYKISVGVWVFIEVAALTVLITLLTVGFQALKGARTNPADKLRSE